MDILLEGLFYNGYGFAEDNRFLLQALDGAGFRVRISALDAAFKYSALNGDEIRYIESFENAELKNKDIYICNIMGSNLIRRPDFRINIARTGFETDRIPAFWVPNLNAFDEVWVFSNFNKLTFSSSGVHSSLKVIPSYCAWADGVYEESALALPCSDKFVFLSVFDWSDRKGYDVLINAYIDEFTRADDVALVIKTTAGGDRAGEVKRLAARKPDAPDIYVMNEMLHTKDLIRLYQLSDAFVLPTRGEGWGRPIMEAMLMELPVIATDWGGPTDYLNEDNAFPIEVEKLADIHHHPIPLFNGHRWAEPSLDALRRRMREVYDHPDMAAKKGQKARTDILERYGRERLTRLIADEVGKFGE